MKTYVNQTWFLIILTIFSISNNLKLSSNAGKKSDLMKENESSNFSESADILAQIGLGDKEIKESNGIANSSINPDKQENKQTSTVTQQNSSWMQGKSCPEIKQFGKQKEYCEDKYLINEGEEKTVDCMKNFCSICCKLDMDCLSSCSSRHAFFKDRDPEELFISVCANKNMGPSFEKFCGSMIMDDGNKHKTEEALKSELEEYKQCYSNFCFDCCSNELNIHDTEDREIQKCMNVCMPASEISTEVKVQEAEFKDSSVPGANSDRPKLEVSVPVKEESKGSLEQNIQNKPSKAQREQEEMDSLNAELLKHMDSFSEKDLPKGIKETSNDKEKTGRRGNNPGMKKNQNKNLSEDAKATKLEDDILVDFYKSNNKPIKSKESQGGKSFSKNTHKLSSVSKSRPKIYENKSIRRSKSRVCK